MIELDARDMHHPAPLERSMDIFKWMTEQDLFHLKIHRLPQPLLMIADRFGIRYESRRIAADEWHIFFSKNPDIDLTAVTKTDHV